MNDKELEKIDTLDKIKAILNNFRQMDYLDFEKQQGLMMIADRLVEEAEIDQQIIEATQDLLVKEKADNALLQQRLNEAVELLKGCKPHALFDHIFPDAHYVGYPCEHFYILRDYLDKIKKLKEVDNAK